jgi:hypothetical protein
MLRMVLGIHKMAKELSPLFQQAREAHEQFTKDWNENFPKLDLAYKETDLYKKRLEEMRQAEYQIENKILPIIIELKRGEIANIEFALAYLAVADRYFRSGYNKEAIIKALKHIELSADKKAVIKNIWQTTEPSLGGHEKKEFIKLMEKF